MANIFRNILDAMKFSEDDEDYDEYVNEMEERDRKKTERESVSQAKTQHLREYREEYSTPTVSKPEPVASVSRQGNQRSGSSQGKVVPFRGTPKELGLCVIKPTTFSDCQDISDMLVGGSAIVINLEGFDEEIAQRIMDFVSGTVYAINGKLNPVSKRIYIVSPENVGISGDVLSIVSQGGVEAPTITKDF